MAIEILNKRIAKPISPFSPHVEKPQWSKCQHQGCVRIRRACFSWLSYIQQRLHHFPLSGTLLKHRYNDGKGAPGVPSEGLLTRDGRNSQQMCGNCHPPPLHFLSVENCSAPQEVENTPAPEVEIELGDIKFPLDVHPLTTFPIILLP